MSEYDFGNFSFNFNKKEKKCFEAKTRYIIPKETPENDESFIKYEKAVPLAIKTDLNKRMFVVVNGSFVFGDYIEALIVEKNIHIKKMIISTLSLSENNIDSLKNLIEGDFVDSLDLIVSDYFFWTEQENKGNSLVPYLYKKLDYKDKFQLSVSRSHTKVAMFETHCGKKIIIHGSANLRSSANLEQFAIENNAELYDWLEKEVYAPIIKKYWTIKKEKKNGK